MSEEAKVGLADEATDVSSGKKIESREEKGCVKFGNSTAITAMFSVTLLLSPTIHRYQTQQKSRCKLRCYRCQVPKFLQNPSPFLTWSFCPLDTIAIASSRRKANFRFFTHWCIFIRSSLFRTGKRSFPWSMFTYNLTELHLIRKMLGSRNNNADQLSSQFVTSIQVIPAKIVSVDCIRAIGLSIKR